MSSMLSWSLLDDPAFGEFAAECLGGRYNLPSREYVINNVITPMFYETKQRIKDALKKCRYIGLTTDAWTSIVQQSFITVTAHVIDEDCTLVAYVLDTAEIKVRHTSENLLAHLYTVLQEYDIEVGDAHKITINYNATNDKDLHEEDTEIEHEFNYLNETETDFAEYTINEDSINSQDLHMQIAELLQDESSQHSVHSTHSNSSNSNHRWANLTFTSDNASDISKVLN